jgi:hypothetical protein
MSALNGDLTWGDIARWESEPPPEWDDPEAMCEDCGEHVSECVCDDEGDECPGCGYAYSCRCQSDEYPD